MALEVEVETWRAEYRSMASPPLERLRTSLYADGEVE